MNFSKLYNCWNFAENLTHPNNVAWHKQLHSTINASIEKDDASRFDDYSSFDNYMTMILNNNEKTSTMIKELVEEIDRLKEA